MNVVQLPSGLALDRSEKGVEHVAYGKRTPYSITWSARASSVGGTSRPSAPLRCAVRVGGHREVKNDTAGQVGGHPQPPPMGVNDRPANRQPHPHAVRFGRKQWIEYPINGARLNTLPRVLHGHHHTAGVVDFRP